MKIVLQRVRSASVQIDNKCLSKIDHGMLLLVGLLQGDTVETLQQFTEKLLKMRIFADEAGKMNLNLSQVEGSILAVSQFTLAANLKRGNRPSFDPAMKPEQAESMFQEFVRMLRDGGAPVETGRFGADMQVQLLNDGPVTFILES